VVGVDAAVDYPLYFTLPGIAKGFAPPSRLNDMYRRRRAIEDTVISSHGDASGYFVTFLDNHDVKQRFRHVEADGSHPYDDQVTLAVACLLTLPGIPCLYYGTEYGLHGSGTDAAVREALWGAPSFSTTGPFHADIAAISGVRRQLPALRYGRFYMRPVSGDGVNFGLSSVAPGVLAYSRILADQEVLVVANTTQSAQKLSVIVDLTLNKALTTPAVWYSNKPHPVPPNPLQIVERAVVAEADGTTGAGPLMTCGVTLQPLEVQLLAPRSRLPGR
jgi:glycosidase